MFNAERLLGSLLSNALGQGLTGRVSKSRRHGGGLKSMAGSLISQNKTAIGMGLLGLAVGAFEHFTQNQNPQASGNTSSSGGLNPVAPMPQTGGGVAPRAAVNWTPPPLPSNPLSEAPRNEEALLLIRAMIAAANADHAVDEVERQAILGKVTASGLGAEERSFIEQELSNPLDLRTLVAQVKSPEIAEQMYAASVLALEVDSDAERNYLQRLASALNLDAATMAKWGA
ncbi:MAG TPA: tellurite resistance TerB family protein [Terriglobia bacterium]|nr:tellurite resistance TerB family protein [Terriglobia bacterium]